MKIRRGTLADLKKLLYFLNSTPELSGGAGKEDVYKRAYIRECLVDKKGDLVLVAEDKEQIVGFLIAEIWRKKRNSFLLDLFVKPEYRKHGVATELRKEHEKICKGLGITDMNCLVLTTNKRMQKHVEDHGFKRGNKFYFYEKNL